MKITVQVSMSVYGSEEYLDGFFFAWYSVLQITVPDF